MLGAGLVHDALGTVAEVLKGKEAKWIVGGSTALMLRNLPLEKLPRDIDIYCDNTDFQEIYTCLKRYAVDEPSYSETSLYKSTLVHFVINEMSVELVGGFKVLAAGGSYETKVTDLLMFYGDCVKFEGMRVPITIVPLAHELWFNQLRGRQDRVRLIADAYKEDPLSHAEALHAIEEDNQFLPSEIAWLHNCIAVEKTGG